MGDQVLELTFGVPGLGTVMYKCVCVWGGEACNGLNSEILQAQYVIHSIPNMIWKQRISIL